jgi:fatty acid synthase subunit beta, fungi type
MGEDISSLEQMEASRSELESSVSITYENLDYVVDTPPFLFSRVKSLRDAFIHTINDVAKPSSTIELAAQFLEFIAQEVEKHGEDLDRDVLEVTIEQFQFTFLQQTELHSTVARLENNHRILYSYYTALGKMQPQSPGDVDKSALLRSAKQGKTRVYLVFGGQGNMENYFDELRAIYDSYSPLIKPFLIRMIRHLDHLAHTAIDSKSLLPYGFDVMKWLEYPDHQPAIEYLISAPVSFPLIGVIQLLHFITICRVLGVKPGDINDRVSGASGHSQGIVTAVAIAASKDWESFESQAKDALTVLFWIGVRSQEAYPLSSIPPKAVADSIENGEGIPSPALAVRGITREVLKKQVDSINRHLPAHRHIYVSLVNSATNVVVTGPPSTLCNLNIQLRRVINEAAKTSGSDNTDFGSQFLPMSAPFHSEHLSGAIENISHDVRDIKWSTKQLQYPVYGTFTGEDIRNSIGADGHIVPSLVRMICEKPVFWEKAISMPKATHIVDFGPGGLSGIGGLTSRIKDGSGVRVILASVLNGNNSQIGYRDEIFARDIKHNINWTTEFGPRLGRTSDGRKMVITKMSTLLGLPPIMVAGMTPTTVPWDFVADTMTAGYEIELAGGGYLNGPDLTEAITEIIDNIPSGRGIVLNVIYASPKSIAWQIPLVRKLCSQGLPIKGLTIGAGVPSLDIANEYIRTLGIRQIGFKPATKDSILDVIKIAEANPDFPIILQWTGGRGGGHHSLNDFHQPILALYGRIRRCENIILVAGSGFGGADDTFPYIRGTWSIAFGRPPMPFDGVLFGSRCMVAKEAHTSPGVKQAIVDTPGVDDRHWEQTMQNPGGGGGIISVRSEMGQPIHKLATRGVLLWAEMDKKIFILPKQKRLLELQKKDVHDYIVQRLHDDFQKPWFGRTANGRLVDLQDLTYAEVAHRMVELMFIKHRRRWIHESLARLTGDFIRHIEQRLDGGHDGSSVIPNYQGIIKDPHSIVGKLLTLYPRATQQLMNTQDCQVFLQLCKRPKQKPVPFVPSLDDDFEFWFKKDSLWQSEDLDAVIDQDPGRVCVLHGPVAAMHSTNTEESIQEILDNVHNGHIQKLTGPTPDTFFNGISEYDEIVPEGIKVTKGNNITTIAILPTAPIPKQKEWLQILAGSQEGTWRRAFLMTDPFIQNKRFTSNPTHRVLAPTPGMVVQIYYPDQPQKTYLTVTEHAHGGNLLTIQIGPISNDNTITMQLIHHETATGEPVSLPLKFTYHPESTYSPIHEVTDCRNERIRKFYYTVWLGEKPPVPFDMPLKSKFDSGAVTVTSAAIRDFANAIGNTSELYIDRPGKECFVPMDFAIVAGWKALTKPLLRVIDGDLLSLVHLSNSFRMIPGTQPFKTNDSLRATTEITAVINQESGKMVEISGSVASQDGTPIMHITSQFLYRGVYVDYENTFQRTVEKPFKIYLETPKHVAILQAKKWFELEGEGVDLVGQTVVFKLVSLTTFGGELDFASVKTVGSVLLDGTASAAVPFRIASVNYEAGPSRGNPVLEYLRRTGSPVDEIVYLERPIPLGESNKTPSTITAPSSNMKYSTVSGDYNPIHTSRSFAQYVGLPGTIVHGMQTSGAVRTLLENWTEGDDDRKPGMVRDFSVQFMGMVLPGDSIEVRLNHVGMVSGCKVIKIEASKTSTGERVLLGDAVIQQPVSAYVFTGQGSQEPGMGMDLYAKSSVARKVWDRADKHLRDTYGMWSWPYYRSFCLSSSANFNTQDSQFLILSSITRRS